MRRVLDWNNVRVGALLAVSIACGALLPKVVNSSVGVQLHENLPYCSGGQKTLLLDVMAPQARGTAPRPALLFVHGGGWQAGNKRDYHELMRGLAAQGAVGFSVEYRLAPGATFPAQVEDVKCAVRWIHAHADEYGIDARRIIAIGGSAGAYLVAMLGTTANQPALEGTGGHAAYSSQIHAMVLHGGVFDLTQAFTDPAVNPGSRQNVMALLGAKPTDNPRRYSGASPMHHVAANNAPALFIHGDRDPLVPVGQAVRMHAALQAAGAKSTLVVVKNGGHADFGEGAEAARVSTAFQSFLAEHAFK